MLSPQPIIVTKVQKVMELSHIHQKLLEPASDSISTDALPGRDMTYSEAADQSESPTTTVRSTLRVGQDIFRVVMVEPALHTSAPLYCRIVETSLDSEHEYEALSYVWGTAMATEPIQLKHAESDLNTFAGYSEQYITQNLEHALRALRLPDQLRTLWIDAICIDQNNIEERNEQIKLMGRIYSQCTRDLVWLGTSANKISRGMDLIQRLAKDGVRLSDLQDEQWSDIAAMIGANPVWKRVWIIQELYFAPKILLLCQDQSLEWDVLLSVLEENIEFRDIWLGEGDSSVRAKSHEVFANITHFQVIRHVKENRMQWFFDRKFIALVSMFGRWEATLTVDKIYALLNVAVDARDFPIDYRKSLEEVSLDLAEYVISSSKSLMILSVALGDPLQNYDRSLESTVQRYPMEDYEKLMGTSDDKPCPGWVVDISKDIPSTSGLTANGTTHFNACGRMKEPICSFSTDRRRITLSGWAVDSIRFMNEVSPVAEGETPRDRWVRDVRRWAPEDGEKKLYGPTNESFLNAYWATITTDRKLDKRISKEDDEGPLWYERYQTLEERIVPDEQAVLPGWKFGYSAGSIFCMFPPAAREGDLIVVFLGGQVPFLLRPLGWWANEYELVGEVYLHGFMDGQFFMKVLTEGRLDMLENPNTFVIV